ncbi:MAG: citrate/2-methylcitrate synthase [Lachnospiraceae bacterium]|nr:citrate/2-methylcitrate synthase [Lachnospiraceae bacterium]
MNFSEITPYISKMAALSNSNNHIQPEMYAQHNVYRGLRDLSGNGVVTGLTEISRIKAKDYDKDGNEITCDGQLTYRGINIRDIVDGFVNDDRFGYEETAFLLLFGQLPTESQLREFNETLSNYRELPHYFVRDMIMKAPGKDMMNMLSRCVLAFYAYDENPDDTSIENVLRQSMRMISVFPMLAVYGYQSYSHFHKGQNLFINYPEKDYNTAQNVLHMLRRNCEFSDLEAKILDLALVLHAEHGGGNNSTFTTHVVTSSGTDTYSSVSAALGSLKGPRHGGANIKVVKMFEDMKKSINIKNKDEIKDYLVRLLDKQAFDNAGLIYGMGHAIYSKSDPRADILKKYATKLVAEKPQYEDEFELYTTVSELAPDIIANKRKMYKGVSANVDFYSGIIYRMLDIPSEIFTPLFAIARISGWSAHRIEELQNAGKIIRPQYVSVKTPEIYVNMKDRK